MTFTSRKLRYEGIFCFSCTGKASTFKVMKTSAPYILLCLFSCLTLGKILTQPRGHLTCTRHKTLEYKSVLPAELISLYIDGMCPSVGRIAACSCWGSVQIAWWRSVHSRVSLGISKVCSMPRAASTINSPPSYKAEHKARGLAVRWEGDTDFVNAANVFKLCMASLLGRCGVENNSAPVEAQLR